MVANISKTMYRISLKFSEIVFHHGILICAILSHLHDCTFKESSILLLLPNAQVHLMFREESSEKVLLFFGWFQRSFHLLNSLKIFIGWRGDAWFKNEDFMSHVFLLKSHSAKNRLTTLLHNLWTCFTQFSDGYVLILMAIYNARYLHNILHDL